MSETDPIFTSEDRPPATGGLRRLGHVLLAAVLAIAAIGYFVGLNDGVTPYQPPTPALGTGSQSNHGAPVAANYIEMASMKRGPNADWSSRLPAAAPDPDKLFTPVPLSDELRLAAVDQRAERRAYSGAPPVIPHAIDQTGVASCLACHEDGMHVGTVIAPRMSHEMYANCTQCHVELVNRDLPPIAGLRVGANRFEGLAAPGPGERASPGAPPTVPHTTWMRENCMSCHGELAQQGLRTTHPWRVNCNQCHASSATLDQMQLLTTPGPWSHRDTVNP